MSQDQCDDIANELIEEIESFISNVTTDRRFENSDGSGRAVMAMLRLIAEISQFICKGMNNEADYLDEVKAFRKEFQKAKKDYDWSIEIEALQSSYADARGRSLTNSSCMMLLQLMHPPSRQGSSAAHVRDDIWAYFERQATNQDDDALSDVTASDITCVDTSIEESYDLDAKPTIDFIAPLDDQKEVEQSPMEFVLSILPKELDLSDCELLHDNTFKIIYGGFGDVAKGSLKRHDDEQALVVAIKGLREGFRTNPGFAKVHINLLLFLRPCSHWITSLQSFAKEIHVWADLEHPNLVKLEGFVLQESGFPFLVSKWAAHGQIVQFVLEHPEYDLVELVCQYPLLNASVLNITTLMCISDRHVGFAVASPIFMDETSSTRI